MVILSYEYAIKQNPRSKSGDYLLSYQDSNLDSLNQNQMYYHYTIGQYLPYFNNSLLLFGMAKLVKFSNPPKKFKLFLKFPSLVIAPYKHDLP